ncbi:glycosyltransferase family 2 protein [uncultured Paludibaculum sp.]|uniref:glycosyltransferase family 2 protein n=1 Tax=uncultured Paludibaculum sp. TaxID=1765020 RepID=UPI002AAC163E|nr:glycosyltransferase family 2 protein [uncultured Paludibaculum sp.]
MTEPCLPLVTVVTPSYNQAEFLRATIESVLGQDYPRIEYLVMDGGSTDGSAEIASEYGGRLTFVSEPDRGQSHAINKGFQRAQGEIVAWINSDDVLLPGAVSAAVRAFAESPGVGAVYGEGYCIDRAGQVTGRFPATEPFNLWRLTWVCDSILQQSTFFRRSAVAEVGWLREELRWSMDWDLLVRLGRRYGLKYIPEYLGCLREYAETKTASGGGIRFLELWRLLRMQTGRWWGPGCWYYGLDTYDKIWSGVLRRWGAEWLATRVFHLCRWKIDRVALRAQGYYPGGWVARRMYWMVPAGTRRLVVRGEAAESVGAPAEQRIEASVGISVIGAVVVRRGEFEWVMEVPEGLADEAVTIVFTAGWSVKGPTGLRVSWRLLGIETS